MDIDATVVAANDYLQKSYINSRYSRMTDEWPPYQPRHYTTLALIHHKNRSTDATVISVTQELSVMGKIQPKVDNLSSHNSISQAPNIYSNTSKKISDIFVSVTARDGHTINPSIILIEGAPGIGKTVLAKEIAFQWASNKLLSEKKILLLLFLRQCNFKIITSFKHLVEYVVKSDKIPSCLAEHLLQTEGKDLAIVFDGYDEVSEEDRNSSIIADILCHKILAKSCIVITSRPTASADLHDTVDCRVEIVGFTEEDRLDYIQTALQGNNDKIKTLKFYLQSNPTINALCYIPLNMTILLCLVENGTDALPKTQTDMYKQFINITILRFVRKYSKKFAPYITSISTLPYPHNRVYEDLAKLAYKALKVDKIVFTINEIKNVCPNLTMNSSNWNGLGLLKAVRCFDFKKGCDQVTFHFLHFSIQEYMAALYISTLSNNKQVQLLKKTFWQHRFYNTWVMYVGITHGSSFALRHFLSGNWLQFTTKILKNSRICNKYLKNKIKCLHLFQCLIESNNEDMTASVSQFFQDNTIGLCNQTLLPSDVNTLGFFLMRSINKQWDILNLYGCNIGSIGSKILCDRFLNNNSRHMVTIRKINFSHNQLNVSSLAQLFELFRSWHTSEIIIVDSDILEDNPSNELYAIVEDAFLLCEHNTQIKLQLGPFYFAHRINNADYMYNRDFKNVYLVNCWCGWESTDQAYSINKKLLGEIVKYQKYESIYWIHSSVPNDFIEGACHSLLNDAVRNRITGKGGENNLFIYNPDLSDDFTNKMGRLMSEKILNFYGVMLIISKSEVQGIIKTVALSNKLSKLALLNLIRKCRTMCHRNMWTRSWRQDIHCSGSISDLIIYTFTELFYKIACGHCKCNLRIALREKDVVIAHNVNYSVLKNLLTTNESTRAVYISDCDIPSAEYETLCHNAKTIYICNGHITEYFFKMIPSDKEIFVHNLIDIDTNAIICNDTLQRCSVVFVTKNVLIGNKPTSEQLALALRLKLPKKVLMLHISHENNNAFNQIMTILTNNMSEIDFTNCNIGENECDTLYQYIKTKKHVITANKLRISLEKFTVSFLPKLTRLILLLKVKDLVFIGINHDIYKHFIKYFCTAKNTSVRKFFLFVTYNDTKAFLFCNTYCNRVTILLKDAVLYVVACNLSSRRNEDIIELGNILHNFINHTLQKSIIQSKLFCISCNVQIQELDIDGYDLQSTGSVLILKALQGSISMLKKIFISKNNITENAAGNVAALISCNIQLQELDISENYLQSTGAITISKALQSICTLTKLFISKNNIMENAAGNIAALISCNTQLQELDISENYLQSTGAITISKALQSICTLKKLFISKNNIMENAASNIAAVISCNIQLQNLDISDNHLQSTGIITISKALQGISKLTKLYISKNNITVEAANYIGNAISHNAQLQEFDINNNYLHSEGVIIILKALQGISTLTKLNISKNHSTYIIADYLAVVICSTQLQELDASDSHLKETGATTISKALQCISTLKKLCISNNFITDKAADDIATIISYNTHLQELDISNNYLQNEGTVIILKALQKICTLTKLNISKNNFSFIVAEHLVHAICHNVQLQELNISDNDLQTSGAVVTLNALKNFTTLTKLCISKNKITDKAVDNIATAISHNNQLQELNISGNDIQTTGTITILKAMQSIPKVTKLCISNNNINDKAASDIAAAISYNTQLQELDISDNNLQPTGGVKILEALQNVCTLKKLFISRNYITDKAADDIAAVISCNTQLRELDISDNHLQTTGAIKISKALQNLSTFEKFYISKNNISDKAADDIATVIFCNTQMQEFDISNNNFCTEGVITILKALQGISTLKKLNISNNSSSYSFVHYLTMVISSNTQLQELNVGDTHLQETGTKSISRALQHISTLKKLYISNNFITDKVAGNISAIISCNIHLQELDISKSDLKTTGTIIILRALQNVCTLRKLNISINDYTFMVADDLANVISHNIHLQELSISVKNFQASDDAKILDALKNISTLTKLCISNYKNAIFYSDQLQELNISGDHFPTTDTLLLKALKSISTVIKLRISLNCIGEEAADDIATVISCNTQLKELDISENNLLKPIYGIKVLKGLQNISTLTKLFISKNYITNKAADDIAAVISSNTQLQELDISNNDLQTTGTIIVSKALQYISTLTKLYISKNNVNYEAADDIAAAISCNTQLQELDISNNDLQTTGAIIISKALQHISTLTKLYISKNDINYEATDDIAAAISCNTQLQELDISNNNLQTTGAIIISKALQHISTLTKLCISKNYITNKATGDIAAVISCNTQLQELDISNNNLQTTDAITISKALQHISTLTKLYISKNDINYEAADDIATAIYCNTQLQELDISYNNLQTGAITISQMIRDIPTLKKFYINKNNFSDKEADDIADILSSSTQLILKYKDLVTTYTAITVPPNFNSPEIHKDLGSS